MNIETIKMSSKGQIVIPQRIREELRAEEGSMFAVISSRNSVILKKIETPSKEDLIKDLERIAKEGRRRAEKLGIKESDVPELIHRIRKERRK
ncbi:MAG: hypothetical protein AABX08_00340 [Nanoarchaeota archaeon]